MDMLTKGELTATKNILSKLQPGQLPFDLFNEICRLTVTPVLEVVCFKKDASGKIRVALLRRAADDIYWSNMYHVPGAVMTANDVNNGLAALASRICTEKLKITSFSTPIFVMNSLLTGKRGTEIAVVYMIEIEAASQEAMFYDVDNLPGAMIEGHRQFIEQALRTYRLSSGT